MRRGGERVVVGVDAALGRAEDDDHVGHDRHDHRAVRVVRAEDEPAVVVVDAHRALGPEGVGEGSLVGQGDLDDAGPALATPAAAEMDELAGGDPPENEQIGSMNGFSRLTGTLRRHLAGTTSAGAPFG